MRDPTATERFAADLGRLFDVARDRLLVAVSGGPDSVALLLLAHHLLGVRCVAATVDHGLRAEAGREAAWVARLCRDLGVEHAVLTGALPARAGRSLNVSARARCLRYDLLRARADAVGADAIATAHHADDQVETLAMRLNRGAGVAGLAGVRASGGGVVRPLLGWRRGELAAIVADRGITPVEDPSNRDPRFDRARMRAALGGAPWIAPDAWSRSAQALADAEDALEWMVGQLRRERVRVGENALLLTLTGLPFELRRRLLTRCVAELDAASDPRGGAVASGVYALDRGETIMLGDVLCKPLRDTCDEPVWRLVRAPPRRSM